MYFSQKQWLEVKKNLMMDLILTNTQFSPHKMLTDRLEWCGLLVGYCDVFISCSDSHSDGTHSLQRIHWLESDEMLLDKCIQMKKQTPLHLWVAWGWVHFHKIFIFDGTHWLILMAPIHWWKGDIMAKNTSPNFHFWRHPLIHSDSTHPLVKKWYNGKK